jgi:hypothetical protein
MPPNTAKVDRATLFGNPYEVRKGTISGGPERWVEKPCWFTGETGLHYLAREEASAKAVELFRAWINHPGNRKHREMCIVGLRGKNLGCWCKLDAPCHADVLLALANRPDSP